MDKYNNNNDNNNNNNNNLNRTWKKNYNTASDYVYITWPVPLLNVFWSFNQVITVDSAEGASRHPNLLKRTSLCNVIPSSLLGETN